MSKKILKGKVISDKNEKTIIVLVERKYQHPFLKKIVKILSDTKPEEIDIIKKLYKENNQTNITKTLFNLSSNVKKAKCNNSVKKIQQAQIISKCVKWCN